MIIVNKYARNVKKGEEKLLRMAPIGKGGDRKNVHIFPWQDYN